MSKSSANFEEYGKFIKLSDKSLRECSEAWTKLRRIFKRLHHLDEVMANGEHWLRFSVTTAEKIDEQINDEQERLEQKATEIADEFGFTVYYSGDPRSIPHIVKEGEGFRVELFPYLP